VDDVPPTGLIYGTPEDALDYACGLYLGDPPDYPDPRGINAALH